MNNKALHLTFAILSFGLAFVVYTMTVQQTVPFWDCGEFSAASIWQQVPHPPGAPLFLMIGKVFHTLIPFGDDGWRVNMVSVVSSAFTVLLLYFITVMTIRNFRKDTETDFASGLATYGAGFIAAAAFTFSDTFWFNAVESEVYAASSLFVAIIVYLMMRWNEEADKAGHEKYILLIAYLIGLSIGVHLLSILTLFSIVLLVYFRKYTMKLSTFLIMGGVSLAVFFVIYKVIIQWIPAFLAGHTAGRNAAMEYAINDSFGLQVLAIAMILGVIALLWYGFKTKNEILKLATMSFVLILIGYTTYTQILLRSNANPPMNENEPKNFSRLSSYLGREQYGNAPTWPRRYQTEDYFIQQYTKKDRNGNFVYGEWNPPGRKEVQRQDGTSISDNDWSNVNTAGELTYFWKYQIQHMYFRYLYWNFVGRESDAQDANEVWFTYDKASFDDLNYKSSAKQYFPIRFFALPLLFGIIGLFFHFNRDKKMAWVYLIMFLLMGVLAAIQQNQQEPQPRERDYFYAGSFMVYSLWIGLGAFAAIEWLARQRMNTMISAGIITVSFILVPLNMAIGGWKIHSRAGNYLAFDYSYNILQSTEEDAILFTNGDNDTFPLWYLQDVAGVRRDVRIVNLSLGNTVWYVDQLKNREPWGAKRLPLSFADDSLQGLDEIDPGALSYDFGEPMLINIPVRREILSKFTNDPNLINAGKMSFTWTGKPYREMEGKMYHIFRVQDKVVKDILVQTKFERPVYFSTTVGGDAFAGLEPFFRLEGMAYRICPVAQGGQIGESMNTDVTEKCLMNVDNSDNFSKTPRYGFKFRGLADKNVYFNEVERRLMISYRQLYFSLANTYLNDGNKQKAIAVLDQLNNMISTELFPMTFDNEHKLAKLYAQAGEMAKAKQYAQIGITSCMELIDNPNLKPEYIQYEITNRYFGPYRAASELYEILGDANGAKGILERLKKMTKSMRDELYSQGYSERDIQRMDYAVADIQFSIEMLPINPLISSGKLQNAYDELLKMKVRFANPKTMEEKIIQSMLESQIMDLGRKLGLNQPVQELSLNATN